MRRICALLTFLCAFAAAPRAHAGVCATLPANPSQSAVQSALNSCGNGNYVQLSAGLTSVSSSINIPCGVQIFGPTVAPFAQPTAKLTATAKFLHVFTMNGSCASANANGVSYVDMDYGAGVYVDQNNHSNIVINHNYFTNIADTFTQGSQAVDVALGNGNTINGFTFNYNTVGDANSCTVSVTNEVTGGTKTGIDSCGLQIFGENSQVSHMVNMTIRYNHWAQSSEAIHFYGANYVPSPPNQTVTCDNCDIEFNFFENVHVISIEFQGQTVNHPLIISNNVFAYPLFGENNTWFISDPCCQFAYTSGSSTINPAFITQNNVFLAIPKSGPISEGPCTAGSSGSTRYANAPCYGAEWGYEYWGNGSLAQHNLFQGFLCVAATVGYAGAAVPVINYNTMQGGQMSGTANGCVYQGGSGSYLTPEFNDMNLAQSVHTPNSQSATPVAVASVAPSISPASGAYNSPPTVTLTDPGYTSSTSYVPLGNTSIWYTTDGSTPVPGASNTLLYTAPFAITLPVTVKAVGMWGVAPQPTSYPGGYGFTPSAVQTATYTSTGGVTLSSVALSNVGAVHSLINGSSIQMNAICTYSDGSTTNCNTPDTYGNGVSNWFSSNPAAASISGSGLVAAVATGSTNVTATVSGLPTPVWAMAVTPAMATLTSVSLATSGGISSLTVGGVNQLLATCTYSDSSTTNCGATDSHGSAVGQWTSTAPTVATVSASGVVTAVGAGGTSLSAAVQYGAAQSIWGQTGEDVTGFTTAGYINSTYFVFGNQMGGYSGAGATCSFFLPSGTLVNGAKFDCGLIPAPTPTTQAASWLCHGTYTVSGTTAPNAFVTVAMAGCPNIAAGTPEWVAVSTNSSGHPNVGFDDCGGAQCNGAAPALGNGAYPYRYIANPYGTYSGMPTAMIASGSNTQVSQYVTMGQPALTFNTVSLTVTATPPTLVSLALAATGSPSTLTIGSTLQFAARCTYSNAQVTDCTVADIYGNAVTVWSTTDATKVSIGQIGAANPGLATAVASGTASVQASVGSLASSTYGLTVANPAVTLTGISLATAGGITGLFIGSTNALVATCVYSDGSHTNCTTSDNHGNVAGGYTSSAPAHATVNAGTGVVTGVAAGTTTLTAGVGGFTSMPIPLTVLAVPSGTFFITITGPVSFSGRVQF